MGKNKVFSGEIMGNPKVISRNFVDLFVSLVQALIFEIYELFGVNGVLFWGF